VIEHAPQPLSANLYWKYWLVVVGVFCLHLALIGLPRINLEWAFFDVVQYFESGDRRYLDRYFSVQANPLALSYLSFLLAKLVSGLDVVYAPRLLSALGVLLLGSALVRLSRTLELRQDATLLIVLVLINPLVWVYSGRGTADFLPAALALFSVSLLWDKSTGSLGIVVAMSVFSLAILLKYHAALLLPMIWIEVLSRPWLDFRRGLMGLSAGSALVLIGPCLYQYVVHAQFGFWVVPPKFQAAFEIAPIDFLTNLISYLGYLSVLLFPLSLLPILRKLTSTRRIVGAVLLAGASFLVGYFALRPDGEMTFGPIDRHLNAPVVYGFLCMCAGLWILVLLDGYRAHEHQTEPRRLMACMIVGIMLFVAALSLTRPAQRYLLFVLPMAYFFLSVHLQQRALIVSTSVVLVSVNVYIGISQYATGSASRTMVQKIQANGLLDKTDPGVIEGHVGEQFPVVTPPDRRYVVVDGTDPGQILCVASSPLPLVRREYCIVPQQRQ